jgi:hypothetical protein
LWTAPYVLCSRLHTVCTTREPVTECNHIMSPWDDEQWCAASQCCRSCGYCCLTVFSLVNHWLNAVMHSICSQMVKSFHQIWLTSPRWLTIILAGHSMWFCYIIIVIYLCSCFTDLINVIIERLQSQPASACIGLLELRLQYFIAVWCTTFKLHIATFR